VEDATKQALLRDLPSIDEVLRTRVAQDLARDQPRWAVAEAARRVVDSERQQILHGRIDDKSPLARVEAALAGEVRALVAPAIRRVINATGVVLHTNLGRAPMPRRALERAVEIAAGYSNLEFDLETGMRGSRHGHLARILRQLTGAEDAVVVNNNAAAVLLVATALAAGREVIVSRGELIEIGGAFRIPDVLAAGGARLREVGTTNRTRIGDYEAALSPETALIMKVHRSNFAVVGFTEEVTVGELALLARRAGVPVVEDLGSGAMIDLGGYGMTSEPTATSSIGSGADLVTISGDKLLGGPQAGIIAGRASLVGRLRKHPLMRAVRPDKLTLASLEATLELYRDGTAGQDVPIVSMLGARATDLRARAERLARRCQELGARTFAIDVRQATGKIGGGAQPLAELAGFAVVLRHPARTAVEIEAALRACTPPVVARVADAAVWLDVRTLVDDGELELVARAIHTIDEVNARGA
jgi:L-seryl-tRNA(Ser) seleniumtransferase